jgi:hypothetical protein
MHDAVIVDAVRTPTGKAKPGGEHTCRPCARPVAWLTPPSSNASRDHDRGTLRLAS